MAIIQDQHQPSFVMWPLQNARTAYRPVYLPVILVVPHVRSANGLPVADSYVWDLSFLIEDAPGKARVAGYEYRGIYVPDFERFRVDVDAMSLARRKIDVTGQRFEDADGNEITYAEALVDPTSYMVYTTDMGDLTDKILFKPDADYYDLSIFTIVTNDLTPLGQYIFSWNASYYRRIITANGELYCIDTSIDRLARKAIVFDHPGVIHQEMLEKTPAFVFEKSYDEDEHAQFYRPFADALQDLFDESGFLETINHIDHIQAHHIPYLANLLGWDLPYFPGATDAMRRRVLRNARRLQALKGSRRAIKDLFDIFGYTIDIINIWYREDGLKFLAPDEDPDIGLSSETVCRAEPLILDYSTDGFGGLQIPFLYRPDGDITLEAWIVKTSSPLYAALVAASDDDLEGGACAIDVDGYQVSSLLHGLLPSGGVIGYSQVLLNQDVNGTSARKVGYGPLSEYSAEYNSYYNRIDLTFDRYLEFESDERLFVFATYQRTKIVVPDSMKDLRSNRFDIRILEKASGEEVNPSVLEFLLNFIHRLKAFHSLLRKIIFTVTLEDVYNVTDFCVGGDNVQAAGLDSGEYQVPPAIIPTTLSAEGCTEESLDRGFKDEDISYRNRVLAALEAEFQAWKALDGRFALTDEQRAHYQSLSSVEIPTEDGDTDGACSWTSRGQDRKYLDPDLDSDHEVDIRAPACDLTGSIDDYCYQGRVRDEIVTELSIPLTDIWRCKPCPLGMGYGFYYMHSTSVSEWCDLTGCVDLTDINNIRRSLLEGLLVRVLAFNGELRYTDKYVLDDTHTNVKDNIAIRRPSLQIEKDNLMIPGHRPASMGKLLTDFTHPTWTLRPWDDVLHVHCAEDAPANTVLDSEIVIDTNGDEQLSYDPNVPLVYYGNGLEPDIPSLGDHGIGSAGPLVTHKIWTTAPTSEFVELEGMVHTDTMSGFTGNAICIPSEIGKVFDSAVDSDGTVE